MLVSKQACIRTLKEQVNNIHNDLVQREGEQRRVHLHVDNREVIHLEIKNDLDMVKENLEKTLSSRESIGELAVSQVLCADENTNDEAILNLNVTQAKIEELYQILGLKK